MPGPARSGHGVLARWRAWLHGAADDIALDEAESRTQPTGQGDVSTTEPDASLDDVLRDAAQRREPKDRREGGKGASRN